MDGYPSLIVDLMELYEGAPADQKNQGQTLSTVQESVAQHAPEQSGLRSR